MAKLGIIGAGAFTDFSLSAYQRYLKDLELVAITDKDLLVAKQLATKFDIPQVASSVEELLSNEQIEVVLVLTPPVSHFELAKKALQANKHLLVEKPIALNEHDARQLIELAGQQQRKLSANLVLRHHPFHQQIAEFTKTGQFGQLRQIATTALLAKYPANHWYWDENVSGGFFLNTFCHFLDLYRYVFGQEASSGHSAGDSENGFLLTEQFGRSLASLAVNLQAANDQEFVQTTYIFDSAVIKTTGWFPELMEIKPDGQPATQTTLGDKLEHYQKALAAIMADLLKRIENPTAETTINHQDLLQAIIDPTRCQRNRLQ